MAIETKPTEVEVTVPEEPKVFRFESTISDLRLWIRPGRAQFSEGIQVGYDPGVQVQFENGSYQTEDAEIAAYIRKHFLSMQTIEITGEVESIQVPEAPSRLTEGTTTASVVSDRRVRCEVCGKSLAPNNLKFHMRSHGKTGDAA